MAAAGVHVKPVTRVSNVGIALALVRNGDADAALVYRTDVAAVRWAASVDVPTYGVAPNEDEVGVTTSTRQPARAADFIHFLASPAAQRVLRTLGFRPPP
jgi:molybdate transport system substrate-binding protein